MSLPSAPSDAGAAGPNENWLVSGTTITHVVHQCCNNLDELWRFDLAGTHPVLPPPGALLASADSVRFTAKSGGALPAPDTVDVSITSTGGPIPDLTLSAAATCSYGVNCATDVLNFSLNADRTPATLRLIFTSTSLPVGTYQAWIHISTDAAPNSPLIIPVTLTMTP